MRWIGFAIALCVSTQSMAEGSRARTAIGTYDGSPHLRVMMGWLEDMTRTLEDQRFDCNALNRSIRRESMSSPMKNDAFVDSAHREVVNFSFNKRMQFENQLVGFSERMLEAIEPCSKSSATNLQDPSLESLLDFASTRSE